MRHAADRHDSMECSPHNGQSHCGRVPLAIFPKKQAPLQEFFGNW